MSKLSSQHRLFQFGVANQFGCSSWPLRAVCMLAVCAAMPACTPAGGGGGGAPIMNDSGSGNDGNSNGGGGGTDNSSGGGGQGSLGIFFAEQVELLGGLKETTHWGISVGDLDGDGHEDLIHGRHRSANPIVALNNGDGSFDLNSDVLVAPLDDRDRHNAQIIDIDNDGDKDIFYGSGLGMPQECWQSDGSGTSFVDLFLDADPPILPGRSRQAVWFDWNGDSFLDIYHIVGRGGDQSTLAVNVDGMGVFEDRTAEAGLSFLPDSINEGDGCVALSDFDADGDLDMLFGNASAGPGDAEEFEGRAKFYRQNQDGVFTDVLGELLGEEFRFWIMAARWGDYDNDGDQDLYLVRGQARRDYGQRRAADGLNILDDQTLEYFCRVTPADGDSRDGFSVDMAGATGVTIDPQAFRGFVTLPDLSGVFLGQNKINPAELPFNLESDDPTMMGEPDLAEPGAYFWLSQGGEQLDFRLVGQDEGEEAVSYSSAYVRLDGGTFSDADAVEMENDDTSMNHALFRNNGDGSFDEVTEEVGIDLVTTGITAAWADFDNDGDLDLLVVNGNYALPVNRPQVLYRNDGTDGFLDISDEVGFGTSLNSIISSTAVADFNGDGGLDFVITYETGPSPRGNALPKYYRNQGTDNLWLEIELIGTQSNRDAIGAKVWLETDSGTQYREQNGGFHMFGQDSMIVHFGCATDESATLTIEWPSGAAQIVENVPTGQRISVTESVPGFVEQSTITAD